MAVIFYMEYLDDPVVTTGNEEQASVRTDAEIPRVSACP